ncbi:MAG: hypothetical protein HY904_08035 [Deltaproteobacteria bacterium]|nr:hypothetical protein [Deltaproteobacteria bacterium]
MLKRIDHGSLATRLSVAALLAATITPAKAQALCSARAPCPVVDDVVTSAEPAPAGGTVQVRCAAHDADGVITRFTFQSATGLFANGASSVDVVPDTAAANAAVTTAWHVPPDPGAGHTVQCTAWDSGSLGGAPNASTPATLALTTAPPELLPTVDALNADRFTLFPDEVASLVAVAHDPLGGALSFSWTGAGGALSGDLDADPERVTWTAVAVGTFGVDVTVTTQDGFRAAARVNLTAVWAKPDPVGVSAVTPSPVRVSADGRGWLYATDARRRVVDVVTGHGERVATVPIQGEPGGIVVVPTGEFWLGDMERGGAWLTDLTGARLRPLGAGDGEFLGPQALAADLLRGQVVVVDGPAHRVSVYDSAGFRVRAVELPDAYPVGVAVDAPTGELYVADSTGGRVRVLAPDGTLARTLGAFGSGPGELTRVGGVALAGDGNVYVVDTFQSRVAAFTRAGAFVAFLGRFGTAPGELKVPIDVVEDPWQRLWVSNTENGRLEVFDLQGSRPVACAQDADCDGLPDAWEVAMALDAAHAFDALLDADGDGLSNAAEYANGTSAIRVDTDGDGVADAVELARGTDPVSALDNLPRAVAGLRSGPLPGAAWLDAAGSTDPNGDPLSYRWVFRSGPEAVSLVHADQPLAAAVLRRAGDYAFELTVGDGTAWSRPAVLSVHVDNVAPAADAGALITAMPGRTVVLDGSRSADPNGDVLAHAWRQVEGAAVVLEDAGAGRARFTPAGAGTYAFELVVHDGAHASGPARVEVVVNAADDHVPLAVTTAAVTGQVGRPLVLDGAASQDPERATLSYAWRQVDGATVTLSGADSARAAFTPSQPGVYGFRLRVADPQHTSPEVPVTVVVDGDNHPPRAAAGTDLRVNVLDVVTLSCALSQDADGETPSCAWTQRQGPPVTPEPRTGGMAFVPVDSGTYVFELLVSDAAGTGTRDRLTVVVDDPARNAVPVAVATVEDPVLLGRPVTLHGEASTDAQGGLPLSHAWTQVAGPWIPMENARDPAPVITPSALGRYAFELRVDDGLTRSPPARVEFAVTAPGNRRPVARAGDDQLAVPGTAVVLDGSQSRDPDGQTLTFRWEQVAGAPALLAGTDRAALAVTPAVAGDTLRFRLSVDDGAQQQDEDVMNLTVVDVPFGLRPVNGNGAHIVFDVAGHALSGAVVDVPPSSFPGEVTLAVGAVGRAWFAAEGRTPLGDALLVGPLGETLPPGMTVQLPLPAALVQPGVDPAALRVARYDAGTGAWTDVEDTTVDLSAGTVRCALPAAGALQLHLPVGGGDELHVDLLPVRLGDAQLSVGWSATPPAETGDTPPPAAGGDTGTRWGCQGAPAGDGALYGALAMGLWWLMRRRPRRAAVVAAMCVAAWSTDAAATDAPHDFATLANGCNDCHQVHNAPGLNLTKTAGNANLCMSCHASGQMASTLPFSSADQAVPRTSGSSHRWDANVVNVAAGATAPTNPNLRLDTGKLMCSTCHDPHSQANAPFDPNASATAGAAGRHLQRIANNANQACLDCHTSWVMSSVNEAAWTGANLSHPSGVAANVADPTFFATPHDSTGVDQVAAISGRATSAGTTTTLNDNTKAWVVNALAGLNIRFTSGANKNLVRLVSANTATQVTFAAASSATALNDRYEIDRDGNTSNNLVLDNAGTPSFTTGNVVCMSCHGVHYADSNTATYDSSATAACTGADCGLLLRRSNNNDACTGCHNLTVHSSATTSTKYGTWGTTFTCQTCHQPHKTPNTFLVRQTLNGKTVDFRNLTGKADNSFATVTVPGNGPCEACHTLTRNKNGTARFRGTGGSDSGTHYPGTCTTCHTHANGFFCDESSGNRPCAACHQFNMLITDASRATKYHHVMEADVKFTAGLTTYPTVAAPTVATADQDKTCVQCHADHNIFREDVNALNTLGSSANLRTQIAVAPSAAGPSGTAAGYFNNIDFNNTFTAGGICISCHASAQTKNVTDQKSSATTVTPVVAQGVFQASAHSYSVGGTFRNGNYTFNVVCTKCHNDDSVKSFQTGTNQFALHGSFDRSLRAPLGITTPTDPIEEQFCYRCHHKTTDTNPGGGPAKTVANMDWYGGRPMTAGAQDVFTQMQKGSASSPAGNPTTTTNTLYFIPTTTPTAPAPADHQAAPTADTFAGGTWAGRTMVPYPSAVAYESQTATNQAVATGTQTWRRVSFVSPPIATATTTTAAAWTLNVFDRESSNNANARVRYAIYRWNANNTKGSDIVTRTNFGTEMSTTAAPGGQQTITTAAGGAVALAVGDKIVVDLEIQTLTVGTAGTYQMTYFFGNGAASNVVMPNNITFTYTSQASPASGRHDVAAYAGVHKASPTDETLAYISANKHVECMDCHNPHASGATRHTQGVAAGNTIGAASMLAGVSGVSVTYSATNFTAPTAYAATTATMEHQICYKCHSGANTSLATWDATWTNVALEFSPANKSRHPVVSGLAAAGTGTTALPAASMKAPWNTAVGTQTMYCSDCHGNDAASPAAQGPHASAVKYMLRGPLTAWPNLLGSQFTSSFCANCHNQATSPHTADNAHTNTARCYNCHVVVPHGGKMSRLIGDNNGTMPTRYAYQGVLSNMWIQSFTKNTGSYQKSNCQSGTSGCTTHGTAATENW